MRRLLAVLLVAAAGLSFAAGRAEAQVLVRLGGQSDSAVAALSSTMTSVVVSVDDNVYNYVLCGSYWSFGCLSYARLTFIYDPTLIDSVGVEALATGFATLSSTSQPGTFTVTGTGPLPGYTVDLFRLRIRLRSGASDGGYVWTRVDSLAGPSYDNLGAALGGARGWPVQVCHATTVEGDVDLNGQVDSRDALITLSAAVGLPVSGFNLARGDVDHDGLTNSRDALMMLSYAIGLPINGTTYVGAAIADACPGITAPGETVVFKRDQGYGAAGGIFRLDSSSTVPAQLSAVASDGWPRLNAAGTRVVFQCADTLGYSQICVMDRNAGANRRRLTGPGYPIGTAPEWNPDGTRIAFARALGLPVLYTMDSSGAGAFTVAGLQAGTVAWSHSGTRLAYVDYLQSFGTGLVHTVTMDTNHIVVTPSTGTTGQLPGLVRWSPNDALLGYLPSFGSTGPIWAVNSVSGNPAPLVTIEGIREFDWGPAGVVFTMAMGSQPQSLWLLKGGPSGVLVRLTAPAVDESDKTPSFRRNP